MSRKFNLDEYEPVEERVKRFYKDHPDGTIVTVLKSNPDNMDYAVFCATISVAGQVVATGWAQERREQELKKSKQGYEYEDVNYTSWLENAETSAIGRALANYNYAGSKRPSQEEMRKHERHVEDSFGTTRLAQILRKKLDAAREIIGEAAWLETDSLMAEHQDDVAWFNKAIERLDAKMAASRNPVDDAMKKLKEAAVKTDKLQPDEAKQRELV